MKKEQLQRCWNACWHRARRPIEGVILSEDLASLIAERSIRNASLDYKKFPNEAEFAAKALRETAFAALQTIAEERRKQADPQLFHDPSDRRYHQNLDLDRLQRRDPAKGFHDSEWNNLPKILRPLAFATLARKGIKGVDAEDVFSDTLVELIREREGSGHAPILNPTLFEEVIPLHARILGFRAVDWYRRRGALKNQPNAGESIDALSSNPDHAMQFEDESVDPRKITFERIYKDCREALTGTEWKLIFALFVTASATIQDLIGDDEFCAQVGINPWVSGSTRRRILSGLAEGALEKIRVNLII